MPKAARRSSSRRRSSTKRNSEKVSRKTSRRRGSKSRSRSRLRRGSRSGSRMHWRDVAPMSTSSRRKMKPSCFLDESSLKYPVCPNRVNRRTCKGLDAARARAVMNGDEYIVAKADKQKTVLMCEDAKSRMRDARIITKSLKRSSRSNTERRQRRHSRNVKRNASRKKKSSAPSLHHLANLGKQIKYVKSETNVVDV
jgi:hypothetical protein